ncbi:conserved hypothetical protein [Rhodopseudomonas palustris HaA2]|uniref:DUF1499 domain-containing protein n=2 Tax=Rhodopseudomonas palustris TaxID=1076 RepID=Q2J0Y6_RHOP2|nr:conserved hypothetical protein [Rhodopseudomonas palustris HaA2]
MVSTARLRRGTIAAGVALEPFETDPMARRFNAPYHMEPVSRLAVWARYVAVFAAITAVVSTLLVRFDFLEVRPAMATFFGALALAGLSILLALAGFAAIWQNGSRGMARILLALLIDVLILAYPSYLGWQYRTLPAIHDITTDPIDPPKFETLARLRTSDGANSAVYAGLYSAELQRDAYPGIETVQIDLPVNRAYELTLNLVNRRKWRVVDARPPQLPRREGHIEAVARTAVMGLPEDVAIRILPDGDGARIDIRSASRFFKSDLGSNAARIAKLSEAITSAAENAPTPKPEPAPKQPAKGKGQPKK